MNFDELILEAAKSIAAATAALIKAASEAQKELVSQGKLQKVSILPTFYEQLCACRSSQVQEDTDDLTVFLRFWDLHT